MVRIGIVGIGFMGRIHYLAAQRLQGGRVTAICTRDPAKRAGDWRTTRGNFGPEPGIVDLSGIKTYAKYDDMLADSEIDLVDICTVTDQHAPMALAALQAGKHVLVEKPIALQPEQADDMVATAQRHKRLLMVAQVLPFFPEFRYAAELIRTRRYGRLLAAHFQRVISQPDWSAEIADTAKTGGPAIDLHIHDTHFIAYVCGTPSAVFSVGTQQGQAVTYLTTSYLYGAGGPAITCSSGAICMKGRPFIHGYEIYLEQATLTYSSGGSPLTLLTADGQVQQPALCGGNDPLAAFAEELQAAIEGVRCGREPEILSGQLARDALLLCYRECDSVRRGQIVPFSAAP
jgi:predicted dehydrogenase